MADNRDHHDDDTLIVALEQLGKALDMMQGLYARIEQRMADARNKPGDDQPALTADIPETYTLH
jgi:hypothetical protein